MFQEVRDTFFVAVFQILLDTCGRFLPRCFLQNGKIPKDSLEFRLYLKIIDAYVYALKRIEERNLLFVIKLQDRRLRKILAIAQTTAWWRSYFAKYNISVGEIRGLADLQRIPPVNRFTLLDVPKNAILTCSSKDSSLIWRQTSGTTTGTPFVWGVNKTLLIVDVLSHFFKEMKERAPSFSPRDDKDFYIQFNYGLGSHVSDFKWFSKGDFYVSSDDKELAKKMEEVSRVLTDIGGGGVIRTNPNVLPFLIQELKAHNLHPPVLFCSVVGQFLDEDIRKLVSEYLNCQVLLFYGIQEAGSLGIECQDHHGLYHIFSERVIFEILDETGEVALPNTPGNITLTCLDNTVMPLIRYQPGDVGILHHDMACACENTTPLLELMHRTTDFIRFSNGEEKPVDAVLRQFNTEPFVSTVRRVQVRQDSLDEIVVLLEVREHISERFIAVLQKRLTRIYGSTLKIRIEQVSFIHQDGQKFKTFVPLKD